MFPIDYNGDVLNHNARVVVDGGIVESTDFLADFSEQTKRVNMPLLLDIYPNAAAAYSLRKLRTAYTGSAIRVRRSSDNTETDIGFNNAGDLDTSALAAFVGNENGFVSTWYDQSGNNRNATQTTQANQPIVVSGGTFFLEKNKPVIYANNRTKRMNIPSFTLVGDYSIIIASTLKSFGRNMWTGTLGLSGYVRALDTQADGFSIRHNGEVGGANFSGVQTLNPELHFFQRFGTNMSHSRNGVNNITTELSPQGTNFTINLLFDGYVLGGQNYMMDANAFEFIIYNSNQSPNRIGIETNINSYYRIYQQEALLLDYYPDAAAAYSLRKLRSGYTGAAIQVRRSSDNAVQNIGFDSNGGLDTTALTTFVGTGNTGFVTTWYDQSGNNRNATQSTTANQPVIFSGGTVTTINSINAVFPDGVNDELFTSASVISTNFSVFIVAYGNTIVNKNPMLTQYTSGGGGAGRASFYGGLNTYKSLFQIGSTNFALSGTGLTRNTLYYYNREDSIMNAGVDGGIVATGTTSTTVDNVPMSIFSAPNVAWGNLPVSEIIVYNRSQSKNRPLIEANINSYYNIYPTDSDANAFVTAAGLTGTTQIQAVNKLVTDLKGYGLWGKMKAIYPFVGGTAASHKFNLKDPRDVDGAFRLVFNGGWTHSATGALPDGSTGYADTKLIPNTSLSLSSAHFSKYNRNNNLSGILIDGVYVPSPQAWFQINYSGGNTYLGGPAVINYTPTTTNGFYVSSRTNLNTFNIFRNSVLLGFSSTTVVNMPTKSIFIGARNNGNDVGEFFNNYECAFATIGDGLTDTEAANLYTAVQTFQTTLGRQV